MALPSLPRTPFQPSLPCPLAEVGGMSPALLPRGSPSSPQPPGHLWLLHPERWVERERARHWVRADGSEGAERRSEL